MSDLTGRKATRERETKHRRSMRRGVDLIEPIMVHGHHYDERTVVMAECAYRAVQQQFSHLSLGQIRKPPRQLMDAKLARQIAIHIMVHRFCLEQRQIARIQMRQRTSLHFALQAIDKRLECDVFGSAYDVMADKAVSYYRKAAVQIAA